MTLLPAGTMALFSAASRRRLAAAVVGSVGLALAEVFGVLVMLPLVQLLTDTEASGGALGWVRDQVGDVSRNTLVVILSGTVLVVFVAKSVAAILFRRWIIGFVTAQEAETAVALLGRYLAAPYSTHRRRNHGEMVRNIVDAVNQSYFQGVLVAITLVSEGITLAALLALLMMIAPAVALVVLTYFAVGGALVARVVHRRAAAAGQRLFELSGGSYRLVLHALGAAKEIKVHQNGPLFVERFADVRSALGSAKSAALFLGELPRYLLDVLFVVGVGLMTAMVFAVTTGPAAFAVLSVFVAAGFRLLPSLARIVSSLGLMRVGRPAIAMVVSELAQADDTEPWVDGELAPIEPHESLRFEEVSFRYVDGERDVLADVSFTIPAGASVAIVGTSGAGKSTLTDLLLGLQTPTTGRITVDGVDIATMAPLWRRSVGYVPQDVFLLNASVAENIAFGLRRDRIDHTELQRAIQLAQLADVIDTLPEGVDTVVGERGVRLSGGQAQRVGIARALYRRPHVLVFDEATSALDNDTEQRIAAMIETLQGAMTVVVVAHRMSTVRRCDLVLHLADGRVDGPAAFDELRLSSPSFDRLVTVGFVETDTPVAGALR